MAALPAARCIPARSILDGRVVYMNFEQSLFISFTHIDNQPLATGTRAGSPGFMRR